MDAICDDQDFLAINLVSVSALLNDFTYRLFEEMGWKAEIHSLVEAAPENNNFLRSPHGKKVEPLWETPDQHFERFVMMLIIAKRILGALDSREVNDPRHDLNKRIRHFVNYFESFFGDFLNTGKICFFFPIDNDKE
jgi:hypothetical protein